MIDFNVESYHRTLCDSGTLMEMRHEEPMYTMLEGHGLHGGPMDHNDWQQLTDISFKAAGSDDRSNDSPRKRSRPSDLDVTSSHVELKRRGLSLLLNEAEMTLENGYGN